jgi:hypothetical protein
MVFGPAIDLEAIEAIVRAIELAAMVVAGLLALGWLACEWRGS